MAFFGGFHACMKLHNCCGMIIGNFLTIFFAAWRNTLNKVLWILYPKDPRQLENELPQYILGHYCSAFIYCWESWGKSNANIPTAADVHKYMLRCAEDSPFHQACLIELRYAEITKLMRMSARIGSCGSVNLFLMEVRFALPIWATSHTTEYVHIDIKFQVSDSDALRISGSKGSVRR